MNTDLVARGSGLEEEEEEDMVVRLTYEATMRTRVTRAARVLLTELHEGQSWSGGPVGGFNSRGGFNKIEQGFGGFGVSSDRPPYVTAAPRTLSPSFAQATRLVHVTTSIGPITVEQELDEGDEVQALCPGSHLHGDWPGSIPLLKALKTQQQAKFRSQT
eukprot:5793046-Prymnesium_polylepis.1